MNGKLINWEDAKVHILTHALQYGSGVFEGIRAYKSKEGTAIFRLEEHIKRLFNSVKIMYMKIPYSKIEIKTAIKDTILANNFGACYIRPIIYRGFKKMGINPFACPVECAIPVWELDNYISKDALSEGIKVKISNYSRSYINSTSQKAKITGNYVNSMFAKMEAIKLGFEEALLLDNQGYIAEGPGENIFVIKDKVIYTTPIATILEGITRDSVIKIAKDLGFLVKESLLAKDELYLADEAFFTGTAAEITPIREVDNYKISDGVGNITKKIQKKFFSIVRGEDRKYLKWLDFIEKKQF